MRSFLVLLIFGFIAFLFPNLTYSEEALTDALLGGIGARPLSLGGAFVAVADEASAAYWNPAGLGDLPGFQTSLNSSSIGSGTPQNGTINLGSSSFSLLGLAYGNWNRQGLALNSLGLGTATTEGINWGVGYKWAGEGFASGGFDTGFLFHLMPELSLGLLGQNLFGPQEGVARPPLNLKAGLAIKPFADPTLLIAIDGDLTEGGREIAAHAGLEGRFIDGVALRVGYLSRGSVLTMGAGFDLPLVTLNLGMDVDVIGNRSLGGRLGLTLSLGAPEQEYIFEPTKVAVIEINGLPAGGSGSSSFLGGGIEGLDPIVARIRKVADEGDFRAILLRMRGVGGDVLSGGVLEEIRSELLRARSKGVLVIAYVEDAALLYGYHLASAADRIMVSPMAIVGGLGTAVVVQRLTGALTEFLGVEVDLFAQGRYKDTLNPFGRGLTSEGREEIKSIVDDVHSRLVDDVAKVRGRSVEDVEKIADGRVFLGREAVDEKLADDVGYFQDAKDLVARLTKAEGFIQWIEDDKLLSSVGGFQLLPWDRIAVVEISGDIVSGRSGGDLLFGGSFAGADSVVEEIRRADEDPFVKAIIVRVDSRGGSAIASDAIWRELWKVRGKGKVVVASMGGFATSGGYYVASAANKIVANATTLTGSIGVFRIFTNLEGFYSKFKIETDIIKSGQHADMFYGARSLSPEERDMVSGLTQGVYDRFLNAVAKGRGMTEEEVAEIAEGRLYTGNQAYNLNLVDELGSFSRAVEAASEEAHLGDRVQLVSYRTGIPLTWQSGDNFIGASPSQFFLKGIVNFLNSR